MPTPRAIHDLEDVRGVRVSGVKAPGLVEKVRSF
jgi:hypothetical protein